VQMSDREHDAQPSARRTGTGGRGGVPMEIVHMRPGDERRVREAEAVFDDPVDMAATETFLQDDRYHLLVAYVDGEPAGFVSAAELLHPDKPRPEMFLNELGVLPEFRRRGIARALVRELLRVCKDRGCSEMWVLTDEDNRAAVATYRGTGGRRKSRADVMFTYDFD
jgi:ribosomal protein S18 acetylase RimI-like enzyme